LGAKGLIGPPGSATFSVYPDNPPVEVVELNSKHVRTAAFAARLRRLRIAYHSGLIRDYADIPPALFSALIKSEDPEAFLRERVAGRYDVKDVRSA
jgi:KTSC domain-containing protein